MSEYIRLYITAEGATEEGFVKDVLMGHLIKNELICDVRSVSTSRKKGKRGGISTYGKAREDIRRWMNEMPQRDVFFSTMFDYYGLPPDFPGLLASKDLNDPYQKVKCVEEAIFKDMNDPRFIPYIQLHEFEALVFANPAKFIDEFIGMESGVRELENILEKFKGNPELINDNPETAPSKRIEKLFSPQYHKVTSGAIITKQIGIESLKSKCPHFREWVEKLEGLTSIL